MKKILALAASSVAVLMAASSALAVQASSNTVGVKAQSETTAETAATSNRPTSLLFTVPARATEANRSAIEVKTGNLVETTLPGDRSLLLAQAEQRESPWICGQVGEEWEDEVYFETQNFYLNICHKKNNASSLLYVGESKRTGDSIKLPAFRSAKGSIVVENGDTSYIIDGRSLSVYSGRSQKPVMQERIIDSKIANH